MPFFEDSRVGSVAGNVRVGNTANTLTTWQSIEYTTSQNFDRRAYDAVNAILVVPGAIGAFRKSAMLKIEGFTTDTLAEDCICYECWCAPVMLSELAMKPWL